MSSSDYQTEYRKWVDSLTPKQRAKLVEQGLDQPLSDDGRTYKSDPTVAFEKASCEFDYDTFDRKEAVSGVFEEFGKAQGCESYVGCSNACKVRKTTELNALR